MLSDLSFPIEQFQHLPNPYPHHALRDMCVRKNIVNLDLASPPPQRQCPRSHPLTPPDTPEYRQTDFDGDAIDALDLRSSEDFQSFISAGFHVDTKNRPSRYLVVAGVPGDAPPNLLSQVFTPMGDLKGMFVRFQQRSGIVVLSWHDIRAAKKAQSILNSSIFFGMQKTLLAAFISPMNLIKAAGESPFVDWKEGNLRIIAIQKGDAVRSEPVNLHAALALFGELSSFFIKSGSQSTTYYASYFDAREAAIAAKSLSGRSILGMSLQVAEGHEESPVIASSERTYTKKQSDSSSPLQKALRASSRHQSHDNLRRFAKPRAAAPRVVSANLDTDSHPAEIEPLSPASSTSSITPPRRGFSYSSSSLDSTSHSAQYGGVVISTHSPGPAIPDSLDANHSLRTLPSHLTLPWLVQMPGMIPVHISAQIPPAQYQTFEGGTLYPHPIYPTAPSHQYAQYYQNPGWHFSYQTPPSSAQNVSVSYSTEDSTPSTPLKTASHSPFESKRGSFDQTLLPKVHDSSVEVEQLGIDPNQEDLKPKLVTEVKHGRFYDSKPREKSPDPAPPAEAPQRGYETHPLTERNTFDLSRIEAGLDTRTTVMIKNVPNKMSDVDLRKFISSVVPDSFDFVYLRFDFSSSANVGYAFVNFVNVEALLKFAQTKLGVKWNIYSSEKILHLSYAMYQGKEALVEKFKNSCVMEMQDEWVPKIFYSSGPQKGKREPFPPPTNPSRARRSQDQRERGLLRTSNPLLPGPRRNKA